MITAKGIVVPAEWDENGNVVAVAVSTYDEDEYLIDIQNEKGKELMGIMRKKIRITGEIRSADKDRKIMTVIAYIKEDDL
jgi:hypothetical protein